MKITDVIRRPLITEKTSIQREDGRTIVFQVHVGANKIEIKRAIEQLLGSKVAAIRTNENSNLPKPCSRIPTATSHSSCVPRSWSPPCTCSRGGSTRRSGYS